MTQEQIKRRRNDIARLLDYPDRVHRNCVRINPHNALEHELEKARQCYELRKKDMEFFTEATFLPTELGGSGRGRADILVLDTKTVIEILNDETEEECKKKVYHKYPSCLSLVMVKVGPELPIEYKGYIPNYRWCDDCKRYVHDSKSKEHGGQEFPSFLHHDGKTRPAIIGVEKLCLWKRVANNDEKKIEEGKKNITFGPESPCHTCDGLNTKCETYRGER